MAEPASRALILAVDDSPEALGLLVEALEGAGMTVLVATSGEQALERLARITPDLVLMDAVMPGLDGFETCRRLKARGVLQQVPVIFMTALSEPEHTVRGLEAGGVDYVTKPLNLDVLLARIRVHLANARSARSARSALDTAGRPLIALGPQGEVLWATPQAMALLVEAGLDTGRLPVPEAVARLMREGGEIDAPVPLPGSALQLSATARSSEQEMLFRLENTEDGGGAAVLRDRFALTGREAEVLLWIAGGKTNRDIAEILGLSPRTVNKHLEGIFTKLGVENRASAAVMASQVLNR